MFEAQRKPAVEANTKQPVTEATTEVDQAGVDFTVETTPTVQDDIVGKQTTHQVPVPGDGNPTRLLLNLFREHYGFTDDDLAASASLGLVVTTKVGGGDAMTAKQILANARVNGGKFALTVTAQQDAMLKRFKRDRSRQGTEAVTTVCEAFIPAELRPVIQPLLNQIIAGSREQRMQAARQLQALIYDGKVVTPAIAKKIREAIDGLQVNFGRGGDAVLSTTRVQLLMAENPVEMSVQDVLPQSKNPFDPDQDTRSEAKQQADAQRQKAQEQIDGIYRQIQQRRTAGTLDRKEASTLYEMTAFLHEAYTGDREAAARDRAMARLYVSTQGERDRAEKQMADNQTRRTVINKRRPDEPTSMRGSTDDERELRALEEKEAGRIWGELNKQTNVPTFPSNDVFTPQSSEGRGATNSARVDGGRGSATLIRTFFRWYAAHQRMMQLARDRERKEQLKAKIARDNTVVVPPKPAELVTLIEYLDAQAAAIEREEPDRAAKLRAQATKIRNTLDLARAFWDQ